MSTDADRQDEAEVPETARDSRQDTMTAMAESELIDMLGGVRGVVESSIAGVVFALAYSVSGSNLRVALWAALISGVVVVIVSLVQRRSVKQAVAGFVGIAIMAGVARFTGKPQDFYLYPILKNAAFALAYIVSILVRWPLLGLLLGPLLGEGTAWRQDPRRLRAYSLASAVWAGMFTLRFVVQLPLYLAGAVGWLGFQAIPLGLPLFLLVCWATFIILVRVPLAKRPAEAEDEADDEADDGDSAGEPVDPTPDPTAEVSDRREG